MTTFLILLLTKRSWYLIALAYIADIITMFALSSVVGVIGYSIATVCVGIWIALLAIEEVKTTK